MRNLKKDDSGITSGETPNRFDFQIQPLDNPTDPVKIMAIVQSEILHILPTGQVFRTPANTTYSNMVGTDSIDLIDIETNKSTGKTALVSDAMQVIYSMWYSSRDAQDAIVADQPVVPDLPVPPVIQTPTTS